MKSNKELLSTGDFNNDDYMFLDFMPESDVQKSCQVEIKKWEEDSKPSISSAFPQKIQFMKVTQKNVNMPKFIAKGFQHFSQDFSNYYENHEQIARLTENLVSKWPPTKNNKKEGNIKHLIDLFGQRTISQYQKQILYINKQDSQIDQIENKDQEKKKLGIMKSYLNRKIMRKIIRQRQDELALENKKIHNASDQEKSRKSRLSYMLNIKGFALRLCNPHLIKRIQSR